MTEKFQNKYRIPSARAAWHDYNGGMYFVTICTQNMEHYFGKIIGNENGEPQMILSEIGKCAVECIQKIETLHDNIFVPLYVVMPNHIHLIVIIDTTNDDRTTVETRQWHVSTNTTNDDRTTVETRQWHVSTNITNDDRTTVETRQWHVSTNVTNDYKNEKMQFIAQEQSKLAKIINQMKGSITKFARQNNIEFAWQTRFHDRIVRNQNELNRIAEYIENNVANWHSDDLYNEL